jgi:hypothetical protein
MTIGPNSEPQRLERTVQRLADEQPLRRAPDGLAEAVLAAIEQRASSPWWRSDFRHWPMTARVIFLLAVSAPVLFACLVAGNVVGQLDTATATVLSLPQFAVLHALGTAVQIAGGLIADTWLYDGAAAMAALYAALFGLGAAAYRILYVHK